MTDQAKVRVGARFGVGMRFGVGVGVRADARVEARGRGGSGQRRLTVKSSARQYLPVEGLQQAANVTQDVSKDECPEEQRNSGEAPLNVAGWRDVAIPDRRHRGKCPIDGV